MEKNSQTIDVIIPVYNGQDFIEEAVQSVFNQTILPKRLIIVDDGSTDATESIIEHLNGPVPIKYVKKANGGLSSARNTGIITSTAPLLAFLDADDIWEKDKLALQLEVFKKSNVPSLGVVYCDYYMMNSNGTRLTDYNHYKLDSKIKGDIFTELLDGNKVAGSGSAVLVRHDCFGKVGEFDEQLPAMEDWDMWLRIAQAYGFDYAPKKLVGIRRHSTNMSTNDRKMRLASVRVLNKWIKIIEQSPYRVTAPGNSFAIPFLVTLLKNSHRPTFIWQFFKAMSTALRWHFIRLIPNAVGTIIFNKR